MEDFRDLGGFLMKKEEFRELVIYSEKQNKKREGNRGYIF